MIRAIVVDDEKLVRKGFVKLVDWPRYGIEVVGEAADSQRALQLLDQQPVDLMFVDITMPGMSGFELIGQVLEQNRSVQSVILTCHHEFDYVQEALRLGAIDYIVKTLLNKDNVHQTMERITGRLQREAGRHGEVRRNFGGALVIRSRSGDLQMSELEMSLPEGAVLQQITPQLSVCYRAGESHLDRDMPRQRLQPDWEVVEILPSERHTAQEAEALLRGQLERWLFYATPVPSIVALQELADRRDAGEGTAEQDRQTQLRLEWRQYKWLLYGKAWQEWKGRVEVERLDPGFMTGLARELHHDWAMVMAWETSGQETDAPELCPGNWSELARSLSDTALAVQRRMADLSLSREVVLALIRALEAMRSQAGDDLTQSDVAKGVGMSRSYFSQCFKQFFGQSFGEVLRKMRVEQAKRFLLESSMPIHEVSAAVGFGDHKHFSRTFKERVGMYPTEYRTLNQGIEGHSR